MIYLAYAHPYPDRSRANRVLLDAVRDLPHLRVRELYSLYPDFGIDVELEQRLLLESSVLVWQHPMYWYSVPPLLKLWFDKVLSRGWAYGEGGTKLQGKRCQWAVTTGGLASAFDADGMHGHPFEAFVAPVAQTAKFCRMEWQPPIVVHGAHRVDDAALADAAVGYRARLTELAAQHDEASLG